MPELTLLSSQSGELHPELAVMLSTSGSSGSPKLVRLSYRNLQANAEAIAEYLSIGPEDRSIAHLPLHYSYGLSILNSHLLVGASCVLYQGSVMERPFWHALKTLSVSNLAGVPYTYEMLSRLRFEPAAYPALRYMTQAGGRLSADLVTHFAQSLSRADKQFYLMYGQTEATARMSYLPPHLCAHHPESIGQPVPGGRFELQDGSGNLLQGCDQLGELVYYGDNVMMGYARDYQDLSEGYTLEALHTGDLAWRDEQGLYYLKGRKDRVRKILGNRIDLDELQSGLQARFGSLACVASDKLLQIFFENQTHKEPLMRFLSAELQLPPSSILLQHIEQLPRTLNGKLDYRALEIEESA
jgi:acyl-coenzyme A synthetase/AMP-(fatty) acid ligase